MIFFTLKISPVKLNVSFYQYKYQHPTDFGFARVATRIWKWTGGIDWRPVLTGVPREWLKTFLWTGDWRAPGEAGCEMYLATDLLLATRFTLFTENNSSFYITVNLGFSLLGMDVRLASISPA